MVDTSDPENWARRPNGDIELNPLVGWTTTTLPDDACGIRLEYVSDPGQSPEEPHALQLVMYASQARELGEALLRMADAPHIPRPPTDSRH